MDFTSLYQNSSTISSPCSSYLLTLTPSSLLILREASSFRVLQSWKPTTATNSTSGKSSLSQLAFSQDSQYCLVASVDAGLVWVYNVDSADVAAEIKTGSEGLAAVRWLPNSSGKRWLACWAKLNVRNGAVRRHRYKTDKTILSFGYLYTIFRHLEFTTSTLQREGEWQVSRDTNFRRLEHPYLDLSCAPTCRLGDLTYNQQSPGSVGTSSRTRLYRDLRAH